MTYSELLKAVADDTGVPLPKVTTIVNSLFDYIYGTLSEGEDIKFPGFGKFSVTHQKSRKGRNPRTGKSLTIASRNVVKFKAGATLKRVINED